MPQVAFFSYQFVMTGAAEVQDSASDTCSYYKNCSQQRRPCYMYDAIGDLGFYPSDALAIS